MCKAGGRAGDGQDGDAAAIRLSRARHSSSSGKLAGGDEKYSCCWGHKQALTCAEKMALQPGRRRFCLVRDNQAGLVEDQVHSDRGLLQDLEASLRMFLCRLGLV